MNDEEWEAAEIGRITRHVISEYGEGPIAAEVLRVMLDREFGHTIVPCNQDFEVVTVNHDGSTYAEPVIAWSVNHQVNGFKPICDSNSNTDFVPQCSFLHNRTTGRCQNYDTSFDTYDRAIAEMLERSRRRLSGCGPLAHRP